MITSLQFLLSLSILVVLHELGHFGAAKWFKTRVEKFYLFFNPGFSLFKKQIGETEYGVGWLPLGGYVKISGMIDESFDKEQMALPPQPWEFRSKPAWQRLIIMVGGVVVNIILGIFLFSMILMIWGESYIDPDSVKDGIAVSELAHELGLRDGDKVLKVGDRVFDKFNSGIISKELIINGANTILVKRNGGEHTIQVDGEVVKKLTKYENSKEVLIAPRYPYEIGQVKAGGPGEQAGIKLDDKIIAVNGEPTPYLHQINKRLAEIEDPQVTLDLMRGSELVQAQVERKDGKIGIVTRNFDTYVDRKKQEYSLGQAIPAGWNKSWGFLGDQIKAFGQMFSGKIKAKDSLGSFITIGKMFGPEWNWERFWTMTASLSLLLGFLNLLPIPALDGGYVMFLLFESVTGIKVPDRVMEIATMAGFALLMILMVYALGLDIFRHI